MFYDIPLILSIDADTYAEAVSIADAIAATLGDQGENASVPHSFERDNDDQRVLYLPSER